MARPRKPFQHSRTEKLEAYLRPCDLALIVRACEIAGTSLSYFAAEACILAAQEKIDRHARKAV